MTNRVLIYFRRCRKERLVAALLICSFRL